MRGYWGSILLVLIASLSEQATADGKPRRWPMIACDRLGALCFPQPEPTREPEPRGTCYCTTFFPSESGDLQPEICRSWDTQGGGEKSCSELENGLRNLGQYVRCGIDVCFTKY